MAADPRASVLVVDDTVENLRLLVSILADHGYDPRPVTNGRDAISAAEEELPDLILLDVTMPEMNGFDVCRALKANDALREVPVIFLTALTDLQDKVRGFAAGGVDFITKPFDVDEVLARVASQVALQRARRDLADSLERLRALERLRDDLVQMVVHDMRSPLSVLLANLEFLKEGIRDDAAGVQAAEDLDAAVHACSALTRMANDLLDVSRMEEGKLPLVRVPADLAAMAVETSGNLRRWERQRSITVEGERALPIRCDGGLVRRVIDNLVSNAIKHTPAGGAIRVLVTATRDGARIAVHDEGPGVPIDARGRIFEKFGAVESRKDQKYHSVGLGLAFCRLAVEAHGGRIGVENSEASGSVFWFELPDPPPSERTTDERS